jgi:hypothetical protein
MQWPTPVTIHPMEGVQETDGPDAGGRSPRHHAVTWFFAVAAVLLFLVAAVMTGLFVAQRGDYAEAKKQAVAVSRKDRELSELGGQLASAKGELEKTNQQLVRAQNQGKDVEEQKKIVATCLRLTFDFLNALSSREESGKARAQAILDQMRTPCNQAEPYVK